MLDPLLCDLEAGQERRGGVTGVREAKKESQGEKSEE